MNHVDTIKVEHNNHSCHNGLTVRNGVNMNLYGIYKRNTIESHAIDQFKRKMDNTKIIVSVEAL